MNDRRGGLGGSGGGPVEAMLIAELATHALSHAVRTWAGDETMTESDIPDMLRQQMRQVGALLT